MQFTKQDAITFLIGLAAAMLVAASQALAEFDAAALNNIEPWAIGLLTGVIAAAGRYLATRLPELLATRAPSR
jgi:hypothetical protein